MNDGVVAVIRREKRVLVIRRGPLVPWAGYWSPVSGKVEPDEGQGEAVVRELREEVGLRVEPVAKVWECVTDDGSFLLH
jgi:8-oxo-dGTP pyrophosphatase MutT (NUDIX family)